MAPLAASDKAFKIQLRVAEMAQCASIKNNEAIEIKTGAWRVRETSHVRSAKRRDLGVEILSRRGGFSLGFAVKVRLVPPAARFAFCIRTRL